MFILWDFIIIVCPHLFDLSSMITIDVDQVYNRIMKGTIMKTKKHMAVYKF